MPREVNGQTGQTLLDAMRAVFPDAEAPCGGAGRCGRCRVQVQGGAVPPDSPPSILSPVGEEEARLLGADRVNAGWRLSCLARFERNGSVHVDRPERAFFLPQANQTAQPELDSRDGLCAAVDIGTTTISCAFADAVTGRIVARTAAANRQRSYGPDVISRIENGVRDPETLAAMRNLVRGQVAGMLEGLRAGLGGARPAQVHICGNTTMMHLWEGASLEGLARMPFRPAFLGSRETELAADGGENYRCRLLPGISAFVGADITAGILARHLLADTGKPELLVDIGTNGEIVLAADRGLTATATAAGPAFEGAAISCGIPAVNGAVDGVTWKEGKFAFTTLGNFPPAGFCGSGLLDLLACLRQAGILDENGGLTIEPEADGIRAFQLPLDPPLKFTQSDVRQLQLAKGAIAAGIRILCRRAGVALADIGRVHLAGSFGSSMSSESAITVGLIPPELAGRIEVAGNSALAGALLTACDPDALEQCARIADGTRVIDLSREEGFQDAFVEAMLFPPLSSSG
ncbi:MAG: DUF4445 domain-containing protein [Anaerolineales bacterium]|nr:DUF4445 domain-containing protein [Anaerolineales bacterium]